VFKAVEIKVSLNLEIHAKGLCSIYQTMAWVWEAHANAAGFPKAASAVNIVQGLMLL